MEVHALSYAYNRGTLLDYVVYYEYEIVNRSTNTYGNFRFGLFNDVQIGYSGDDYIGFDSSRRLAICYNGNNNDGATAGFPSSAFGTMPPQVGVTMIHLPGDVGTSYIPAGTFGYYNNDASVRGVPTAPIEYDNYLRSRIRNGQHCATFTGSYCAIIGSVIETNYMFSGDPVDAMSWSECACNTSPEDRRTVLASNDFVLGAGTSQKILIALVATDTGAGGCGGPISFSMIREVSDTAWGGYHNPPPPLYSAPVDAEKGILHAYPNPAANQLFIDAPKTFAFAGSCIVYNTLGEAIHLPVLQHDHSLEIDIRSLQAGIYHLRLEDSSDMRPVIFVKE